MYLLEYLNPASGFRKYFTAVPAVTDELQRAAYRIRHDVYCRELSYEPLRADELETDEYDAHAAHCLLKSKANGEFVGCIRLVFARPDDPSYRLPFERMCGAALDRSIVDPARLQRDTIAEVSRLAVISAYRRRQGERTSPGSVTRADFGTRKRPRFPYIPVGLYLGMIVLARRHGIETLFMLSEARLAGHLRRLGIRLQSLGPPVEYRGLRSPSMMSVSSIVAGLSPFVRPMFELVSNEIEECCSSSRAAST
jgi:N-acyl amino acid synthase of PEP-CTERM/exosortase system